MDARTRALQALIRLRQTEVDQAKSALSEAMGKENAAIAHVERQRALIESERVKAASGQVSMDDFRVWLPSGKEAVQQAEHALIAVRQVSDQAREALIQANAAQKAAQAIMDRRLEEEKETLARREQAEIDDLSRRNKMT
ncbi:flagellar FliJ family protein [Komagataeibacter sp. FNDCR2]|uniref:flagellar FliJ family protein n=1 Tax=Komagataeibacter sp. FNDCR2 TaxID=2878682 RepID=UPI001E3F56A0|nr:flagellar FliJ family protein [Komagataeibacter sp. FNDCR2]MCE2576810.1 flagellar FliJ family protein [Komagataeibacter sp. FNDCR2]